ncbi:MAG TPA: hypothetical protein VK094_00155 [Pseudogracilibacillus sp.]|nr:hypothetical protein [Pseudogracilibacillus sp.]
MSEFTGIGVLPNGTFTIEGIKGSVNLTTKDIRRINEVVNIHSEDEISDKKTHEVENQMDIFDCLSND